MKPYAAASFGGMNTADLSSLAEITSVDLLETVVQQFYNHLVVGYRTTAARSSET